MNISTDIWVWIMAACIMSMLSFLYKENPIYRIAEHVFVGGSAGHAIGMGVGNIHRFGWQPLVENAELTLLVAFVLGILLYARFVPKFAWLSRFPIAFLVGVGTGQSLYTSIRTQVINQTIGAITVLPGATPMDTVNAIIGFVGVLAVLTYFLFSIPQKGPVRVVSKAGRWLMMITFGVSFGNVVAGRISVLLGELTKLFGDWLGMI